MNASQEPFWPRAAQWLAFASAASILISIAVSQILLGAAILALLLSREKPRLLRAWLPLGLFLFGTILSLLLSGEAATGMPQVRKMYVYCMLPVVYMALRRMVLLRGLVAVWAAVGSLGALCSFYQFAQKYLLAHSLHQNFSTFYVGKRITGFMSHWNTFSALELFALIAAVAFLLFAPNVRLRWLWAAGAALLGMAVVLTETRGVWIAGVAAAALLLWWWKRWVVALIPVAFALGLLVSPQVIRDRVTSILHPRQVDSNEFRKITWRTGLAMIRQHPWFGLGPEVVHRRFFEFVPADAPKPLPEGYYGHLHNVYLHYAAERGIPTMLALLWFLLQAMWDFGRGLRASPPGRSNRRFLLATAIAVIVAVMVEGFVELNLGDSEVLTAYLVVVGAGYLALDLEPVHA